MKAPISFVLLVLCYLFYSQKTIAQQYGTLTDPRDGAVYKTVKIGEQVWMAENLKATSYNNGTSILHLTNDNDWKNAFSWNSKKAAYCWYSNEENKYKNYGAVYNWLVVSSNNLCPIGWHIPTKEEFSTLITFLGGEKVAGDKLKEKGSEHWNWSYKPNSPATNESGFTALPSPWRDSYGPFALLGPLGCWWSATEQGENNSWLLTISNNESSAFITSSHKGFGYSVRCLKNN